MEKLDKLLVDFQFFDPLCGASLLFLAAILPLFSKNLEVDSAFFQFKTSLSHLLTRAFAEVDLPNRSVNDAVCIFAVRCVCPCLLDASLRSVYLKKTN